MSSLSCPCHTQASLVLSIDLHRSLASSPQLWPLKLLPTWLSFALLAPLLQYGPPLVSRGIALKCQPDHTALLEESGFVGLMAYIGPWRYFENHATSLAQLSDTKYLRLRAGPDTAPCISAIPSFIPPIAARASHAPFVLGLQR